MAEEVVRRVRAMDGLADVPILVVYSSRKVGIPSPRVRILRQQ